MSALKNLFAKISPSKSGVAKKLRMDDDDDDAQPNATSFNAKDREFLLELTQVMATSTAEQIKQAVDPITAELKALKEENARMAKQINDLEAGGAQPAEVGTITQQVIEKLKTEKLPIFSLRHPPGLTHVNQSDSLSTASTAAHFDEFVIGCLGRDDESSTILARAKEVLKACGVSEGQIRDLSVPFAFGSIANVKFVDPKTAGDVSRQIWNSTMQYPGAPTKVLFDRRKSKTERWPGRFLKEILRLLKENVGEHDHDPKLLVKCGASKRIYYERRQNEVGVLNPRTGVWVWCQYAIDKFPEDKREEWEMAATAAAQ
mmetsp:Transcript_65123/g.102576  ORF Transcript_65123/g.102576 Transcript_65123/m.102576 type:complete len:317 (-) Transcript_65123:476-1426(-)